MSFKSWFWALEDAGGSWLVFGILILICVWSLILDTPMFQILALYLDFEGAKNIHVLLDPDLGFRWCWRLLIGVWHLDFELDMVNEFWYTQVPNCGSLSWFWRWKDHPCPLRSWFGALEDAGGPWLRFGIMILFWIWSPIFDTTMFWILVLYPDFEGAKNIHVLLDPDLILWRMLEVPDKSLASWFLIWIGSLVVDTPMFQILAVYLNLEVAKNIHVLLDPDLGLWRMLKVPDLGLTSWL